jgi:hypothetical protein
MVAPGSRNALLPTCQGLTTHFDFPDSCLPFAPSLRNRGKPENAPQSKP